MRCSTVVVGICIACGCMLAHAQIDGGVLVDDPLTVEAENAEASLLDGEIATVSSGPAAGPPGGAVPPTWDSPSPPYPCVAAEGGASTLKDLLSSHAAACDLQFAAIASANESKNYTDVVTEGEVVSAGKAEADTLTGTATTEFAATQATAEEAANVAAQIQITNALLNQLVVEKEDVDNEDAAKKAAFVGAVGALVTATE